MRNAFFVAFIIPFILSFQFLDIQENFITTELFSTTTLDPREEQATEILSEVLSKGPVKVPGAAVSVVLKGKFVYNGAVGDADIETGQATTPDTRFRLYSTAKALTSVAAFRMAEQGMVDLDAPIGHYLMDLPTDKQAITLRQLLMHKGGVRHYHSGEWTSVSQRQCTDPKEALSDFIDDPLLHEAGGPSRYTSYGYVLVSAVLQAAASLPYTELMRKIVFRPADMTGIAIEGMEPMVESPVATFYFRTSEEGAVPVSTDSEGINASCKFGGGGFVGRASDLAAFGSALIDGRLISDSSLAEMTRLVTPAPDDGSYPPMGYGIFTEENFWDFDDDGVDHGPRAYWHGGSAAGGYSVMVAYPDQDLAVGIAANVNSGGILIGIAHRIAQLWADPSKQ